MTGLSNNKHELNRIERLLDGVRKHGVSVTFDPRGNSFAFVLVGKDGMAHQEWVKVETLWGKDAHFIGIIAGDTYGRLMQSAEKRARRQARNRADLGMSNPALPSKKNPFGLTPAEMAFDNQKSGPTSLYNRSGTGKKPAQGTGRSILRKRVDAWLADVVLPPRVAA